MQQISSSWSLFWKLFFPTFYLVFFGLGNMVFWLSNLENYDQSELLIMKILFGGGFLLGVFSFYKTVWKIKRVDMDEAYLYVSNYFKTAKYSFDQIEKIKEKQILGRRVVSVYLKGKGVFGHHFGFITDKVRYDHFFKKNPTLAALYATQSSLS